MLNNIIVIDDVVSKMYQEFLENELLGSATPWYFKQDAAYDVASLRYQDKTKQRTPVCGSLFFNVEMGGIIHAGLHFVTLPIAFEAFSKAGIEPGYLVKSRSFLYFPLATDRLHDNPHVDAAISNLVCLYYVNDSDGDTFIFDKTAADIDPDRDSFENVEFKIVKRIEPKRGRAVIFDGSIYHASSNPTKGPRCIVNFNFTTNRFE